MAKPLDDRILAAMGHGARAATVSDLINEVAAAIDVAQIEHDALDARSKSATSPEDEAEAAAEEAGRVARRLVRLQAKRQQLQGRYQELMDSERRKRHVEEYEAIRGRRDQLAADIKDRWPVLVGEIIDLIERIEASDAEIEASRRNVPSGCDWLESAESMARGCPANWYLHGGSPVLRFTKMKIPTFDGTDTLRPNLRPQREERMRMEEQERQRNRSYLAQKAAEEARFARYMVTPPDRQSGPAVSLATQHGAVDCIRRGELMMTVEQAAEAQAKGCNVEPLAAGQALSQPADAHF
ncbi:hypothetical protein HRJ34_21180 [Rhizorhabdus wittichii]|uniref:Uncharacterized protein n=1 Tax=Rhizorhabdus wittichii TaxID=160791 RepID=A0A975D0X5_9SPHN|nr:hypothetical protein [Rhizorhabdus wittichii]QTH20811.1 hypothetical protein HRJ34_21180 [Rhizorhabdus wittichii]